MAPVDTNSSSSVVGQNVSSVTAIPMNTTTQNALESNPFLIHASNTFNVTSIPLTIFLLILVFLACILFIALVILCVQSFIRRKYRPRAQRKRMKPIYVDEIPGLALTPDQGKYGSLEYSLEYNVDRKELKIGVLQANNLSPQPGLDTLDPYVTLTVGKEENDHLTLMGKQHRTRVIKKCDRPCWQEFFVYHLTDAELSDAVVIFEVFDFDSIGQDISVGRLRLVLKDIDQGEYAGKVLEHTGWLVAGSASTLGIGELCVGVGYYPRDERLDVLVIEARDLSFDAIVPPSKRKDLYVAVKLKHKNHLVKKVDSSTRREYLNPYFNDKMSFKFKDKYRDGGYILCELKHRGALNMSTVLGTVMIGDQSDQTTGVKQWEEMLKATGKIHIMWHSLTPEKHH